MNEFHLYLFFDEQRLQLGQLQLFQDGRNTKTLF